MIFSILGTVVLCIIGYFWIKSYFSPLNHIPEPPRWPIISQTPYLVGEQDTINTLSSWANTFKREGLFKYKSIFEGLDYLVVLTKAEFVKKVLSKPNSFVRDHIFFQTFFPLTGNGLLTASGESHRHQRKVLGKVFAMTQMKHYAPIFNKHTTVLVEKWKTLLSDQCNGKNFDLKEFFNNLSFDIIGEIAFGYQFHSQISATNPIVSAFKNQVELLNMKSKIILKLFPFMNYFPLGPGKIINQSIRTTKNVMAEVLLNRKEKIAAGSLTEQEENDMLSLMMKAGDDETNTGFTDQVIKDNCFTFAIAGYETTSTALSGIMLILSQYPKYQENARQEILENLNRNDELNIDNLKLVPYTVAVIQECLRLFTAIPAALRINKNDETFGKYKIPKGTKLFIPYFCVNTNEEYFDNSFQFIPERYLDGSNIKTGTSFTFGYGPYNCIGQNLAMTEIKLIIIQLLRNFKFIIDSDRQTFYRKFRVMLKHYPAITIRVVSL